MKFGLIGGKDIKKYPIADTLWRLISEETEISFDFSIYSIGSIQDLYNFFWEYLEREDFTGFNVALPWKTSLINVVDSLDENIKIINTVYKKDGRIFGTNTDIKGVAMPLSRIRDLEDQKILILGAGGAGLAAGRYLSSIHKAEVYIFDLCEKIIDKDIKTVKSYDEMMGRKFDIVINATPVGKFYFTSRPKAFSSPIDLNILEEISHKETILQEMNYFPDDTFFLQMGKSLDLKTIPGVEMLLIQALESLRCYTDFETSQESYNIILNKIKSYSIEKTYELLRKNS